jgi:DNA-binding LacI/PurR family transcriptional regulator
MQGSARDAENGYLKTCRVVGYDGIDIGNYYNPKLTTISQPVEKMAEASRLLLLFDLIDKKRKPMKASSCRPSL